MKFSCLKDELYRSLAIVGRTVSGRTPMPITQNVLLNASNGMLTLQSTNMEVSTTTWIPVMIEDEGSITVPYRLFSDYINLLPSDRIDFSVETQVTDEEDNVTLNIKCGRKHKSNMATSPAADFPHIPDVSEADKLDIDPDVLREGIGLVLCAVATDESRPVLTGVELKLSDNRMLMAAADGFRLALYSKSMPYSLNDELKVVIPAKALNEVYRLANNQEDPIEIILAPESGNALFKFHNTQIVSQLLQGNFPQYEQLIPDNSTTKCVLNTDELKRSIQLASIFARDSNGIVKFELTHAEDANIDSVDGVESEDNEENAVPAGNLKISSWAEEVGNNDNDMDIEILEGKDNKIAFNVKYVQDILSVMGRNNILIELEDDGSPGVFKPVGEGSPDYIHVIMPMHVTW